MIRFTKSDRDKAALAHACDARSGGNGEETLRSNQKCLPLNGAESLSPLSDEVRQPISYPQLSAARDASIDTVIGLAVVHFSLDTA